MAILVTFLGYSWIIFAKCEKSLEKWQFLNAHKKLTIRDMHEVFFCASRPLEIDCFQYFHSFLQCHMDQGNNHNQKDWRSDEDKFQSLGRTFFDQKKWIVQKPRPVHSHTPYGYLVFIHPLMIKWWSTLFLCVNFFYSWLFVMKFGPKFEVRNVHRGTCSTKRDRVCDQIHLGISRAFLSTYLVSIHHW